MDLRTRRHRTIAGRTPARRRLRTATATCLAMAMLLLLAAQGASAAEGYEVEYYNCSGYAGSGVDAAGTAYLHCGTTLTITARDGTTRQTTIPRGVRDLAPSPDGSVLWGGNSTIHKFVRRADGSYGEVANGLDTFPYGGVQYEPRGWYVDTDAFGNLFVSNGTWQAGQPTTIVKYAPDGTYLTRFGDYANGAADSIDSWAEGDFRAVNTGVAVTRDGRYVYTVENGNNRVQSFALRADGTYAFDRTWGNTFEVDPDRQGICVAHADGTPLTLGQVVGNEDGYTGRGYFASTYDIAVDGWGYVYVMGPTCGQATKFTADGKHLATIQIAPRLNCKPHGIGIDGHGNIYGAQCDRRAVRTTPEPGPWPGPPEQPVFDEQAPTITEFVVPRRSSVTEVATTLRAADDLGVTEMRIDVDDVAGAWEPYDEAAVVHVADNAGDHLLTAWVRDAAGNVSAAATGTVQVDLDNPPPAIVSVGVPDAVAIPEVPILLDATDDGPVDELQMRVSTGVEDHTAAPWVAFSDQFAHPLDEAAGWKVVRISVRDGFGNVAGPVEAHLQYDPNLPPPVEDVETPVINAVIVPADVEYRGITVQLDATDDVGIVQMRVVNESDGNGNWTDLADAPWIDYMPEFDWTLSPNPDTKAVIVQVRDASGKISDVGLSRLRCVPCADGVNPPPGEDPVDPDDVQAPVVTAVQVPEAVEQRGIAVVVAATDNVGVTEMRVSNEADDQGNWIDVSHSPWEPFQAEFEWTLSPGANDKAVMVQVRDAAGNVSEVGFGRVRCVPCDDGEGVPPPEPDPQVPVLSAVHVPENVEYRTIDVRLEATDDVGVAEMRVINESDENGNWTDLSQAQWEPYRAEFQWTLSPGPNDKAVMVQVRDAAGNQSEIVLGRVRCVPCDDGVNPPPYQGPEDLEVPTITLVQTPDDVPLRGIPVRVVAQDDIGVTHMRIVNESDGFQNWTDVTQAPWVPYEAEFDWTLSPNPDTKAVIIQVRDAAGKISDVGISKLRCVPCDDGVNDVVLPPIDEGGQPVEEPPADAVAPIIQAVTIPAQSEVRAIHVSVEATDDVGITQMRVVNDSDGFGNWTDITQHPWVPFQAEFDWMLAPNPNDKAVIVQVRDAAGNESDVGLGYVRCVPCDA